MLRTLFASLLVLATIGSAAAQSTTYIQPNGAGGYTVTQPFNPGGTQYINPNGAGGYTVTQPFGGVYGGRF